METVRYEDTFAKLDIRVGTVTKAEAVPKSDKLLRLEVDFGAEIGTRQIVAGIASILQYVMIPGDASLLEGLQVCAVLNLVPRKMMGLESNGMILAAHDEKNRIRVVQCIGAPKGAQLG